MAKFAISQKVLADILRFNGDITGPGEGISGSIFVNQELCELFKTKATQEVTLLSFEADEAATPRFKMVGENKNIPNPTGKYQLRGNSMIRVGNIESPYKMHIHTAALFAKSDKVVLTGTVGIIDNGRNKDKMWLSLRGADISTEDLTAFVTENVTEATDETAKTEVKAKI